MHRIRRTVAYGFTGAIMTAAVVAGAGMANAATVEPAGRDFSVPPAGRDFSVPPADRDFSDPAGRDFSVPPAGRDF